ncbi:MAG: hypothetical protein IPO21_13495 [Bacteroidales bacterium]|nr:hypothetical protein [Bacteroidales bacterium]
MKNIRLFLLVTSILNITLAYSQTTGVFADSRDGQEYKTVEFDGKIWLSKNLNFKARGSWCYDNKESNCDKYGRIYDWQTVMNGIEMPGNKGICPEGWHVATFEEWQMLSNKYDKTKDLLAGGVSGFNILFAGCRFPNGNFEFENQAATFWTSTIDESDDKYVYTIYAYSDKVSKSLTGYSTNKTYGQYLRCVKD